MTNRKWRSGPSLFQPADQPITAQLSVMRRGAVFVRSVSGGCDSSVFADRIFGAGRGQRSRARRGRARPQGRRRAAPSLPQHPGNAARWVSTATVRPASARVALTVSLLPPAGEKELVVLGDFGCSPQSSELDVLRKERFCPLVPPALFTNISTRSPQGSRCLDHIWISRSLRKIFSGKTARSAAVSTSPEPEPPVLHRPLAEGGGRRGVEEHVEEAARGCCC